MRITRVGPKAAAVATAAIVASALSAAPATAHGKSKPSGTKSLAAVLTADKSGFDRNDYDYDYDYDILTAAVLAVLKAKPSSPVKVRPTERPRSPRSSPTTSPSAGW